MRGGLHFAAVAGEGFGCDGASRTLAGRRLALAVHLAARKGFRPMIGKPWAVALSLLVACSGCSLTKPEPNAEGSAAGPTSNPLARLGRQASELGQLIAPSRNALKIMIASRPVEDPALGDALWQVVDEQAIDSEVRRKLEANGLRFGVVDGHLPTEVEKLLDPENPPTERIDPVVYAQPDGVAYPIGAGPTTPAERVTLFLNKGGSAVGRDYEQARGVFRVTATQQPGEPGTVKLRVVPEIHHGPIARRVGADTQAGPFDPQQFVYHDGQEEESLRELAATVSLQPDQVLVLGCWPEKTGSLGHFLLMEPEPGSDRMLRKVIFIWASSTSGSSIPWIEPVTPPKQLQPIDPEELDSKLSMPSKG